MKNAFLPSRRLTCPKLLAPVIIMQRTPGRDRYFPKKTIIILFWTVCLLFIAGVTMAAEYIVATNGNDTTGTGTLSSPFATLTHALTTAQGGDTITLRGGTYPQVNEVSIEKPNLTIRSYPGEWAIIMAPWNNENIAICFWLQVEASGCKLQRLELAGGYYYVIKFETNWDTGTHSGSGAGNILVEDCRIHGSGHDCIKIAPGCDDIVFRRCEIFDSGKVYPDNAEGIDNVNGDRMLVQECYIHDITTCGIYAKGGSIGSIIERCLIMNCGLIGVGVGFDSSPEFFDTAANPDYFENINGIVRNCIIINTGGAGIGLYASKNAQIYNNTLADVAKVYHSGLHFGIVLHDWAVGVPCPPNLNPTLRNNIVTLGAATTNPMVKISFTEDNGGLNGLTGMPVMSNNRYYKVNGEAGFCDARPTSLFEDNLANWQVHISGDGGSTDGNPLLDANYHLTDASPCINAGYPLTQVTQDYDGGSRSGRNDIGADQYGSGKILQVPPPSNAIGIGRAADFTAAISALLE